MLVATYLAKKASYDPTNVKIYDLSLSFSHMILICAKKCTYTTNHKQKFIEEKS